LDIVGFLINRYDGRKKLHQAMSDVIRRRFGEKVFNTTVTPSVKIEETSTIKKTIFQHDRKSTGARDFMELGREVLSRLGLVPARQADDEAEMGLPADGVEAADVGVR
jgi:chromosome partitioning protein